MILSERQLHFYGAIALACLLPVMFGAGLIFRPLDPIADDSLDSLFAAANFAPPSAPETIVANETITVGSIKVLVELGEQPGGDRVLFLQPTTAFTVSDPLVYWVPGTTPPETVPDEAVLLGQLTGTSRRQFPMPSDSQGQSGQLFFYSLGQNQAIAAVPLPDNVLP